MKINYNMKVSDRAKQYIDSVVDSMPDFLDLSWDKRLQVTPWPTKPGKCFIGFYEGNKLIGLVADNLSRVSAVYRLGEKNDNIILEQYPAVFANQGGAQQEYKKEFPLDEVGFLLDANEIELLSIGLDGYEIEELKKARIIFHKSEIGEQNESD